MVGRRSVGQAGREQGESGSTETGHGGFVACGR